MRTSQSSILRKIPLLLRPLLVVAAVAVVVEEACHVEVGHTDSSSSAVEARLDCSLLVVLEDRHHPRRDRQEEEEASAVAAAAVAVHKDRLAAAEEAGNSRLGCR